MPTEPNKDAATLYSDHSKSLKRYALRLVPNSNVSDAEDVVQETFAATVKHLNNGNSIDSPKGFLFTTARNVVKSMFYNSRQHQETDRQPDMDEFEKDAHTCSPEHRVMAQQQLDAFSHAIAQLPEKKKQAFVLRRVLGESCKEIAATMGLSERTVSNYAAHGWKALNEYCDRHGIVLNDFSDLE